MKTKLIKWGLVLFHWMTLAGVISQEFWVNRYAHNVLVVGMFYWIVLGVTFCLASLGYALGAYTPSMISAAISLSKPVEPAWWRNVLRAAHAGVLLFALITGHWWCAIFQSWVWCAAITARACAKNYLRHVSVEGAKATVPSFARN